MRLIITDLKMVVEIGLEVADYPDAAMAFMLHAHTTVSQAVVGAITRLHSKPSTSVVPTRDSYPKTLARMLSIVGWQRIMNQVALGFAHTPAGQPRSLYGWNETILGC